DKVPEPEDLGLGNDAVKLEGTVLYADLSDSTDLVQGYQPWFAAEMYKAYLWCCAKIIRDEGGTITAYDGDRIMGIFVGGSRRNEAVQAALRINGAVSKTINPLIGECYPKATYRMQHVVGVDDSKLFAARTGIRGSNDIVWVGQAANYAAKLSSRSYHSSCTYITKTVYDVLKKENKLSSDQQEMWQLDYWDDRSIFVYRSTWCRSS
ncbi:MAG TPA: hypothetical protein VF624_07285, partial [Tepidisphaeraceae bacterium]